MNVQNKMMVDKLKRKGLALTEVAIAGAVKQAGDNGTIQLAVGVGIMQGLKYNGNLNRGIKAGLTVGGVVCGINAARNVASNWDYIQNA